MALGWRVIGWCLRWFLTEYRLGGTTARVSGFGCDEEAFSSGGVESRSGVPRCSLDFCSGDAGSPKC